MITDVAAIIAGSVVLEGVSWRAGGRGPIAEAGLLAATNLHISSETEDSSLQWLALTRTTSTGLRTANGCLIEGAITRGTTGVPLPADGRLSRATVTLFVSLHHSVTTFLLTGTFQEATAIVLDGGTHVLDTAL
jgi:hypothetical protein